MGKWDAIVITIIACNGLWVAIAAYINDGKLRKRLNYMQEVLIKKGVVGEYDFTPALRGIKIHDEDDED